MIPKHTVIQYIRSNKKIPYGVLVAIKTEDGFRVGWSLCRKEDRFSKTRALDIAIGRAQTASGDIWNPPSNPHSVYKMLPKFYDRCMKYYKVA